MDDESELQRAQAGDRAALKALLSRWVPHVRRWAWLATGDIALAEEGAQEALVRFVRHLPRVDPSRPLGPWLRTVVVHACRTEQARSSRRSAQEADHDPADAPSLAPGPDRRLDLQRAHDQVLDAFRQLSPRQREIVDLVDRQGLRPVDVADRLGLTPGAVRGQLHTARRALRAHLVADDAIVALLRDP